MSCSWSFPDLVLVEVLRCRCVDVSSGVADCGDPESFAAGLVVACVTLERCKEGADDDVEECGEGDGDGDGVAPCIPVLFE